MKLISVHRGGVELTVACCALRRWQAFAQLEELISEGRSS
jgi:hypothetical protein